MLDNGKLEVIIVEDEEHSATALLKKIEYCTDNVEVIAICHEIQGAYKKIKELQPQIVFLDLHLGSQSGFDLLDLFDPIFFEIIILTADDKQGIKAVKYQSLDYLLKPINSLDLIKAIEKAESKIIHKFRGSNNRLVESQMNKIPVFSGSKVTLISIDEIVYVSADGNYSWFHLSLVKRVNSTFNIKKVLETLPKNKFYRVHRSFIVNILKVQSFVNKKESSYLIMENGEEISVSESYRKEFFLLLKASIKK